MFETILDPDISLCDSNDGKFLLLLHHFLSVFILAGSILLNCPKIHLLVMILVILVWYKYKRCITTIYNNKLCYFESTYKFKNYFYHFRNKFKYDNKFMMLNFLLKIVLLSLFDIYLIKNCSNNFDENTLINEISTPAIDTLEQIN